MHKLILIFIISFVLFSSYPKQSFAQGSSDVTFDTIALTYPFDKKIKVPIIGTERFAKNIKGEAVIERRKSVTLIQIDLGRLPPPSQVGTVYSTYVIWAITPEGLVDNIGEYRQRDNETLDNLFGSEISTSTPFPCFSLIITAEPHYLVSSPSKLVVVANQAVRESGVVATPNQISFSGASDYENVLVAPDPSAARKDNRYPIELLQSQRALEIARYYEAENFTSSLFNRAREAYENGERAYQGGNRDQAKESAQMSIRLAERARSFSVSRRKAKDLRDQINEKDEQLTRLEDEIRTKAQTSSEAQNQLEEEKRRRRSIEQENERLLKDLELARRETTLEKQTRELDRNVFSRLETENQKLREDLEKTRQQLDAAQKSIIAADNERKEQQQREQSKQQREQLREQAMRQFETRRESRGLMFTLPDTIFGKETSTALSVEGTQKLAIVADWIKLTNNKMIIETFTDNRGLQDARFQFTKARTESVLNFFVLRGIPAERMQGFANGGSNPKADNKTIQGRTSNRRVELVVIEESLVGGN